MLPFYGIAFFFAAAFAAMSLRALVAVRNNGQSAIALHRDAYPSGAMSASPEGALSLERFDAAAFRQAASVINGPVISASKQAIDILLCILLLVSASPIFLLTAVLIKLDSKGPIIYRQRRVGYRGRVFSVFKFRSMKTDAEIGGPQYAAPNDERVTGIGRFLRKYRIDELPQVINVLRGEMSLVGPRPERPEFVAVLEGEIPHYHQRHTVKPGITGWAQVKYEYAASVDGARNKLRYDLYYIRHFSPLLDLAILLMTVRVTLFGLGSR